MQKFFVKDNQIIKDVIEISGIDVNHITNVLRLKVSDEILVCNVDKGISYKTKIIEINKENVKCNIVEKIKEQAEANIHITIFQGLPKAEKMELIIQKCTELGVKEITPVQMERCVVKLDEKSAGKKIERWQKIAEAAAKQSKRDGICKINNIINIKNICNMVQNYDIVLVPYENEENLTLKEILKAINNEDNLNVAVVIGPEGGFEEAEIELLKQNNGKIITLGKRILRTETVAITMSSIIMYEFGNLG